MFKHITNISRPGLVAWIFMLLAIVTEVIGISIMKMADDAHPWLGYAGMLFMITLSYICLSQATKEISVAIAYSVWEGIGLALITLIAVLFFQESLNPQEFLGIFLVIVGIVLITSGETRH